MAWRSGPYEPAAVEPHARRDLERSDHGNRLRKPVAVAASWHLEHGQAVGIVAGLHFGGGGAISARAHG